MAMLRSRSFSSILIFSEKLSAAIFFRQDDFPSTATPLEISFGTAAVAKLTHVD
jgi:hypothetical protein